MRPYMSVEMPPTNPHAAPSREMPTAMLRQEPPTAGRTASRPSAAATGTKSISASPQLNITASTFRRVRETGLHGLHRLAALAVQRAQAVVDLAFAPMEFRDASSGRLTETTERRHRRHGLADRPIGATGDRAQHRRTEQDGFLRLRQRDRQARRIGHDLPHQRTAAGTSTHDDDVAVDLVR